MGRQASLILVRPDSSESGSLLLTPMPRRKDKTRKTPEGKANVIHVVFGPGGGRVAETDKATESAAADKLAAAETAALAVTALFSAREAARLLGVTVARLRTLSRSNIVSPSGTKAGRAAYTFEDLIALRATKELLGKQVRLRDVREAVSALKKTLPRVARPLQELRIVSDGRRVVVRAEDGAFEPLTGQMVMDFQTGALRDDVVKMLRPQTEAARTKAAYDLYTRASTLDEDPDSFEQAERLYRRAIELDPQLAIAYTNLGNILFRRGDERGAEEFYRKALEIDGRQPEGHYNLGYVMLERGLPGRAIAYFQRALQADPRFADAHFNLAMALEAISEPDRARTHWRLYLELEPEGSWADIAREHLR